jgi:hypothetical protein
MTELGHERHCLSARSGDLANPTHITGGIGGAFRERVWLRHCLAEYRALGLVWGVLRTGSRMLRMRWQSRQQHTFSELVLKRARLCCHLLGCRAS